MKNQLTISNALKALAEHDKPFKTLYEHGSLQVEIYKPEKVDHQQPHERDELYVIASGSGQFINGDSEQAVEAGQVLFVPAGQEHRFVEFTDDFSTWVFFYGPQGGESGEAGESNG